MSNDFGNQMKALTDKYKLNLKSFVVRVINEINVEIIISTPGPGNSLAKHPQPGSPTGFLRGSWFASLGTPQGGVGVKDPSGSITIDKAALVAAGLNLGDTYYMVNNATYAARLEYGFIGTDKSGREFNQKGRAWVRTALARAPAIAKQVAEDMKNGTFNAPTGGISGGVFTTGPRAT